MRRGQTQILNITKEAVDVSSFLNVCATMYFNFFAIDPSDVKKGFKTEGFNWIINLYNTVCFDGKDFRDSIPRNGGTNPTARDPTQITKNLPSWVDCGLEVQLDDSHVFAYVVRGAEDADSFDSELFEDPEDPGTVVPIVSYRLLQAIVSIIVACFGVQKYLKPAKLGANVCAACNEPLSAPDQQNWAIHGHSGLNFVAGFVYKESKLSAEKRSAAMVRLPPFKHLLMMALRMDQSNWPKMEEEKERLRKLGKKTTDLSKYPTLDAIFANAGLGEKEVVAMQKEIVPLTKVWGKGAAGRAKRATGAFVDAINKEEGGSSKPTSGVVSTLNAQLASKNFDLSAFMNQGQ